MKGSYKGHHCSGRVASFYWGGVYTNLHTTQWNRTTHTTHSTHIHCFTQWHVLPAKPRFLEGRDLAGVFYQHSTQHWTSTRSSPTCYDWRNSLIPSRNIYQGQLGTRHCVKAGNTVGVGEGRGREGRRGEGRGRNAQQYGRKPGRHFC